MSTWEHQEADPAMTDRIRGVYQAIHDHLGEEAPPADTEIEPTVTADDKIHFWTADAGYALAGDSAVRYLPVDGSERADYFKNGEIVRSIVVPPTPNSN